VINLFRDYIENRNLKMVAWWRPRLYRYHYL